MRGSIILLIFCSVIAAHTYSYADKIKGTNEDDVLYIHATAGEPPIAQDYINGGPGPNGETIRTDPDGEINDDTRTHFEDHPIHHHRIKVWGYEGADHFIINTYISGKVHIVAEHVNNNIINWNGVAGENDEVHDHWVDYFSTVILKDFDPAEGDTLEIRGHTVALKRLRVTNNGDTKIWVQSQQGNGGGAHDEDELGLVIVRGVALEAGDMTFTHANDGIMETFSGFLRLVNLYDDFADAKRPSKRRKIVNKIKRKIINDK